MCFRHKEQYSTLFNYHEFNFELLQRNTARKAIFPISRRPEKMAFPKKLRWNIIFFKLSGKLRFFPQKYDHTPGWKMKDDLSKKNREIWYFLGMFWYYFQRGSRWGIIFLVLSGKLVFFSWKHDIFFTQTENKRDDLSQEIHGNMIFSIWYFPRPPAKKIKDDFTTQKCT